MNRPRAGDTEKNRRKKKVEGFRPGAGDDKREIKKEKDSGQGPGNGTEEEKERRKNQKNYRGELVTDWMTKIEIF